jgi:flagellar basal body-associated protein FliL
LNDSQLLSDDNKRILLILLIVASGSLLLSMFIIMPVTTKVHKDKDKLLSLFLKIDTNDVKEQLKKCKDFFTTFHNDDKHIQNGD